MWSSGSEFRASCHEKESTQAAAFEGEHGVFKRRCNLAFQEPGGTDPFYSSFVEFLASGPLFSDRALQGDGLAAGQLVFCPRLEKGSAAGDGVVSAGISPEQLFTCEYSCVPGLRMEAKEMRHLVAGCDLASVYAFSGARPATSVDPHAAASISAKVQAINETGAGLEDGWHQDAATFIAPLSASRQESMMNFSLERLQLAAAGGARVHAEVHRVGDLGVVVAAHVLGPQRQPAEQPAEC